MLRIDTFGARRTGVYVLLFSVFDPAMLGRGAPQHSGSPSDKGGPMLRPSSVPRRDVHWLHLVNVREAFHRRDAAVAADSRAKPRTRTDRLHRDVARERRP